MTWPKRYGGGERSSLERHVVLEELLAAGAPLSAHLTGDRQSGPLILRAGSEDQRFRFLPPLARGEISFCIGMSEPGAGSDLAAISTSATPDGAGWILNGRKIWTSNAHLSDFMICLARTCSAGKQGRHSGLSQFIVDLKLNGITIEPIRDMTGSAHFCEVTFDGVRLPRDSLVGREGDGWQQVTAELAFERSGPERFMTPFPLMESVLHCIADGTAERRDFGRLVAHFAVLRHMSLSVAAMLEAGNSPGLEAAIVKDLGTSFEQRVPERLRGIVDASIAAAGCDEPHQMLNMLIQAAPSYSLRGGTTEIMRSIIARELSLR